MPFELDSALLRRHFELVGARNLEDFLSQEVASRMLERLDYMLIKPRRVLDLGCGAGFDLAQLKTRYPEAEVVGVDFVATPIRLAQQRLATPQGVLRRLLGKSAPPPQFFTAEAARLPLKNDSISLIWSNLTLATLANPLPVFQEMRRVLEVEGLTLFATLGPDTFKELRSVFPDNTGPRVHPFIDIHDLGDALIQAGLSDPVLESERITLTYSSFDEIIRELREVGSPNACLGRPRGLTGKGILMRARAAYEVLRADERLPVTVELIHGHAWKAAPRTAPDGRHIVRLHRPGKQ